MSLEVNSIQDLPYVFIFVFCLVSHMELRLDVEIPPNGKILLFLGCEIFVLEHAVPGTMRRSTLEHRFFPKNRCDVPGTRSAL